MATAIVGAGLAATTGAAFAGENDHDQDRSSSSHEHGDKDREGGDHHGGKHHDGDDETERGGGDQCGSDVKTDDDGETTQSGLVNVADTDTVVPTALCQNNIPANILGVQVPIQDLGLNLPVLSPSEDGGGNSAETN